MGEGGACSSTWVRTRLIYDRDRHVRGAHCPPPGLAESGEHVGPSCAPGSRCLRGRNTPTRADGAAGSMRRRTRGSGMRDARISFRGPRVCDASVLSTQGRCCHVHDPGRLGGSLYTASARLHRTLTGSGMHRHPQCTIGVQEGAPQRVGMLRLERTAGGRPDVPASCTRQGAFGATRDALFHAHPPGRPGRRLRCRTATGTDTVPGARSSCVPNVLYAAHFQHVAQRRTTMSLDMTSPNSGVLRAPSCASGRRSDAHRPQTYSTCGAFPVEGECFCPRFRVPCGGCRV